MRNQIQLFSNPKFGEIRVIEIDNQPWFVASDVCRALDLSDTGRTISRLDEDEGTRIEIDHPQNPEKKINVHAINEPGLYSLVLGSRKKEAKAFKRWITHEVIPAIRKTGGYIAGSENLSDTEILAKAVLVAQKTIEDREKRIALLTEENNSLKPKADYFDDLVDCGLNLNFRDSAKELGIKPRKFTDFLLENNIVFYDKFGHIKPYERYIGNGWFVMREVVVNGHKRSCTQTLTTVKGRSKFRTMMCDLRSD